jgi:hypothetical protein
VVIPYPRKYWWIALPIIVLLVIGIAKANERPTANSGSNNPYPSYQAAASADCAQDTNFAQCVCFNEVWDANLTADQVSQLAQSDQAGLTSAMFEREVQQMLPTDAYAKLLQCP